jgi:cytochrome b6-f complex iron-sulfur subunit
MNRRKTLELILTGSALIIAGVPVILEGCTKQTTDQGIQPGQAINVDLSSPENAALNNPGGSKIIQNILIGNLGGSFFAVSSICTHQGCTVMFSSSLNKIICPCHGSEFNTNGSVVTGPAFIALQNFQVTKTDNILKITV